MASKVYPAGLKYLTDGTTSYIATVGTTGGITDPTGATLPSSIQPGGILP